MSGGSYGRTPDSPLLTEKFKGCCRVSEQNSSKRLQDRNDQPRVAECESKGLLAEFCEGVNSATIIHNGWGTEQIDFLVKAAIIIDIVKSC